ncbi:hypothetical protein C1H46_004766 [Malus baccata]|uniref:TIR domain-containing protein n=1 Tax=Malus baccata TaxID=106549 RepID=A0A540NGC8_MALBA|nr:hypothetical protein C1H46_004766 [Malus baccata]
MDTSTALEASCPSSPSSPTSSSSSIEDEIYDVFLSFSGEDTRKTFTDHLYWTLKAARVDTFIDKNESMSIGETISDKVKQAIQGSRISVIIFSRRYADSIRCLEELVKIMECKRTMGQIVLPIFYDVDPSDVKNQSGTFAEAFQKHKDRFHQVKDKEEKLGPWRNALTEAADLPSEDFAKTDGYQGVFITKIVDEITGKLKSTSSGVATGQDGIDFPLQEISYYTDVQAGLDSRVQEICNYLDGVGGSNDVRMIGICGMGGIGMHDMIQDMGREIVLAEFSGNPEERSRLRVPEDVEGVLRNNSGTRKLMGPSLDLHEPGKPGCSTESFQDMQILSALKLTGSCMHHSTCLARSPDFLEIIELEKLILKDLPGLSVIHRSAAHLFNLNYLSPDFLMELIIDDCKSLSKFLPSMVQLKNLKYLHLENCNLTNDAIPKDLGGLSSLEVLDLSGNEFSELPTLSGLFKLQTLQLDNCKYLQEIPDLPKQLEILEADECTALAKMPDFSDMLSIRDHSPKLTEPIILQRLQKLEILDLGYCHHLKASPDFSKLPYLKILFLNDCKSLSVIHPSLSGLSKLRYLHLENCNLTNDAIPKDLGGLSSLEVLDLSGNEFSVLPSLSGLSKLRSLYLKNCNLTNDAIPKDIGGLSSLEVLDLSGNEFSVLPSLSGLSKLRCLYLKNSNLINDAIPKDLGGLSSLEVLDLSGNEFSVLPSLSGLSELRSLYLKNCNLTNDAIPKDLGGLSSLEVLDLSGNEFSVLPSLSGLSKLRSLYLKNCNLTNDAIPKDLGDPSSLEVLDFSGNEFSVLPSLSGLSKLRFLYLKNSNLTNDAIPKDLGGLSSLEDLDLGGNDFSGLPSLSGLHKLKALDLGGCHNFQATPDLEANECITLEKKARLFIYVENERIVSESLP